MISRMRHGMFKMFYLWVETDNVVVTLSELFAYE